MSSKQPIVSFDHVSFTYEGADAKALDCIDLQILEGEFVCLLGGNGSGKTTLAKMINGLLLPDAGSVKTDGMCTNDPEAIDDIRQCAGMVFQNPDDQMIGNSVEDDVAFGPENLRLESKEVRKRVDEALRQVGLLSFAKHETRALSGGQKQRVAIAAALAMKPRILILDEAASMLDPRGRHDLLKACKRLNESGLTVIMVTHFLEEVISADRAIVLQNGKVAESGPPAEILGNSSKLESVGLGATFSVQLSNALIERGIPIGVRLTENSLRDAIVELGFSSNDASKAAESLTSDSSHSTEPTQASDEHGRAPIIRFDDVSYSYLDKSRLKKILKREPKGNSGRKAKRDSGSRNFEGSDLPLLKRDSEVADEKSWGVEPESVWAISGLSLEIDDGDFLGIIGHTGSGKSTLLKMLAGLATPSLGEMSVLGMRTSTKEGEKRLRELVGIVLQYPERQLFAKTVFDDCAFGPMNLGIGEQEVEKRVIDALELVGISDRAILQKSPFQLSGGQQRRIAIAGVLAMQPKVLVLDEPTAGLDPKGTRSLLQLIKRMQEKNGTTIVMVSHNMDSIAHLCNKVLILNKGMEYTFGSPIEVFSDVEKLKKIGLGLPSSLSLSGELMISGFKNVPNIEQLTSTIAAGIRGKESL